MLKVHKSLGLIVIVAALCATSAQAVEVLVDPGPVGSSGANIGFTLDSDTDVFDLVFEDGKGLEFGPGILAFLIERQVGNAYTGYLSDELGNEIPDTAFEGAVDLEESTLTLSELTVWYDMHFFANVPGGGTFFEAGTYNLVWTGLSDPVVVPEPSTALLLGSGFVSLGLLRRRQ